MEQPQTTAEGGSTPLGFGPFPRWTMRQVIGATLVALGVVLGFVLLVRFYMVVFIYFVAVALEVATRPAVAWLTRRGLRAWMAVLLVYLLMLLFAAAVLWAVAPMLAEQTATIIERLPDYYQRLRDWLQTSSSRLLRSLGAALPLELSLPELLAFTQVQNTTDAAAGTEVAAATSPWGWLGTVSKAVFLTLALFALAFYWALEGEVIVRRFLMRIPLDRRDLVRGLITEMEGKIGGYFRGQAILCVIIGVLSTLAFFVLRIPYALILGLLMGIFEALPVIGPTLGAIPAVIITLAVAPDKVILVVGALVTIQVLENNLLVPRVMGESVGVNAIVSILAITAFGILFGLAGAILAIPLAAILQIFINRMLFDLSMPEEVVAMPAKAASVANRNQYTVLRMEAQALAQDVRKNVRNTDVEEAGNPDEESQVAEDMIETVAKDIDGLLLQMEGNA
ncbi:MAG: AI-2E family transporter [Caldilineaceae bacterium]|nr:AI-2E family transporter [Caldilineaceae bacterium]